MKKGSSPVVDNAPTADLDACNQIVLNTLKDPSMQHQNPHNTADADWLDATWDVADKFWGDPIETDDQAFKSDVESKTSSKVVILQPGESHSV